MTLQITTVDIASVSTAGQNGQLLITGSATSGSVQGVATSGSGTWAAQVTGSWSGEIGFEQSMDGGTTYTRTDAYLQGVDRPLQSVTGNCIVRGVGASASQTRLRAIAAISGAAVVSFLGNVAQDVVHTIALNSKAGVKVIQVQPAITSGSAYAVHDVVGGIQTLTGCIRNPSGNGILESLSIFDAAATSAAFELFFFKNRPTNGTYANDGAITINPLDIPYFLGKVDVAANNSARFGTGNNAYAVNGIGMALQGDSSGNVYAVAVTLSAPTWTGTSQLTFNYGVTSA